MRSSVSSLWHNAPLWKLLLLFAIGFSLLSCLYSFKTNSLQSVQNTQAGPSTYAPALTVAPAERELRFGDTASKTAFFGGRAVPLPPGEWTVVARIPMNGSHGVTIDSIALARLDSQTLTGLITLVGNDISTPIPGGFRSDGTCERSDLNYVNVTSNFEFGAQECQTIDYLSVSGMETALNDGLLRAAYGELKNKQYALPTTLIGPSYRFADQVTMLIARYLFSPEAENIPAPKDPIWSSSDWNKYSIAKYPDKQAYLNRLIVWTNKFLPLVRQGFEGKIKTGNVPPEYISLSP